MECFAKGQLVAVRDGDNAEWTLRVYDHSSETGQHFCRPLEGGGHVLWWAQVRPAEEIWPEIHFARERR